MKKPSQRDRVKAWLLEKGTITNVEAMHAGIFRLSERIRELQADGLQIEGDWLREDGKKTGTFVYRLLARPKRRQQVVETVWVEGRPVAKVSYVEVDV